MPLCHCMIFFGAQVPLEGKRRLFWQKIATDSFLVRRRADWRAAVSFAKTGGGAGERGVRTPGLPSGRPFAF